MITIYEAHSLIELYAGMRPLLANEWLLSQVEVGAVERFYETPVSEWQENSVCEASGCYAKPVGTLPHPKYWRFRKEQVIEATYEYRRRFHDPWRTRAPAASAHPWISHALAKSVVSCVAGCGPGVAEAWLFHASRVQAGPRSRFSPRALAELERKSLRERIRAQHPTMTTINVDDGEHAVIKSDCPSVCLWFHPAKAMTPGTGPKSELTSSEVEWHLEELRDALAREFPAVALISHASTRLSSKGAPRRPPQDQWAIVLVETGIWFADKGDPGTDEAAATYMANRFTEHGWEEPSRETRRAMGRIARTALRSLQGKILIS